MKLKTVIALYLLTNLLTSQIAAQTTAGIVGRRNLLGYEGNIWMGNSGYMGKFSYERMATIKSNFGIALTRGTMISDTREDYGNTSGSYVNIPVNGKYYQMYGINAETKYRSNGVEIFIKHYRGRNPLRNLGLFWAIRLGYSKVKVSIPANVLMSIEDPGSWGYKSYKYPNATNAQFGYFYNTFELGKTYKWFDGMVLFTPSVSLNFAYNKYNNSEILTLEEFLINSGKSNMAGNQLLSINFSLLVPF